MVTGIDPGVESGESVARTVTARAVMPNQGPPAARRAVRGVGADELNRHGKRGVDRGGRIQPADALSHQYAYSTSGSQSARRRHVVGPVRASTPGEYRQASLLSWTRKLASRSDELGLLRGLGHRHDADLLHQCELVPERPGLDDLAILELAGDDTGDVGLLAGGGDVRERAGVRATGAQVLHDVVALGDLALDDDPGVRERCRVDLHGLPRALRTATEVRLW